MRITVKGYHRLRRYTGRLPDGGRMAVPEGASPAQVMDLLRIPGPLQADVLLFVNGRPFAGDRTLNAGDTLVLLERVTGG